MNEVIKFELNTVKMGEFEVKTVDGRKLQRELKSTKKYSDWVKDQIERLGLIENEDYTISLIQLEGAYSGGPGRPPIDYAFTIESAKHIAISSLTEKGKEVRKYFIEIERRFRALEAKLLREANIRIEELEDESLKNSKLALHFKKLLFASEDLHERNPNEIYKELRVKLLGEKALIGCFAKSAHINIRAYIKYLMVRYEHLILKQSFSRNDLIVLIINKTEKEFEEYNDENMYS